MDLQTATPAEVDTAIAELDAQAWQQQDIIRVAYETLHNAANDRWTKSDSDVLELVKANLADEGKADFFRYGQAAKATQALVKLDAASAEHIRLQGEIDRHEMEFARRPWTRFHQLRSTTGGRIHGTRWCQGLHRSNLSDLGWHPELSGKTEAEAVAELGPVMCSKCFPSAPEEWRLDPKDLKPKDPNECRGVGADPVEGTIKRHKTYTGISYYGECPGCEDMKRLRSGNKIPQHNTPKSKGKK